MPPEPFVVPAGDLAGERWPGDGPTVVLLHAGVTDRRTWRPVLEVLDGKVDAITVDRRGHGDTPPSTSAWTPVGDLLALLDHLDVTRSAWLVGNSIGGRLALDAAWLRPERVTGLVLIAPGVSGEPRVELDPDTVEIGRRIDEADARGDLEAINELELQLWLDGPGQPAGRVGGEARRVAAGANLLALRNESAGVEPDSDGELWEHLEDVGVPALVLCGTLDLPHVRRRAEEVGRRLPAGRFESFPGVAHLPSVEAPDELARRVLDAVR